MCRNVVEFFGFGSFSQPNPVRADIENLRNVADMYLVQEYMNQVSTRLGSVLDGCLGGCAGSLEST